MTLMTLQLPTEIPWERICVTEDMLGGVCQNDHPAKWQSSLAVFKYVPDEDYQTYPGREITYLKLAVTVCAGSSAEEATRSPVQTLLTIPIAGDRPTAIATWSLAEKPRELVQIPHFAGFAGLESLHLSHRIAFDTERIAESPETCA